MGKGSPASPLTHPDLLEDPHLGVGVLLSFLAPGCSWHHLTLELRDLSVHKLCQIVGMSHERAAECFITVTELSAAHCSIAHMMQEVVVKQHWQIMSVTKPSLSHWYLSQLYAVLHIAKLLHNSAV